MTQHFINGRHVAGRSGETMAVLAPATGEEFTRIACGTAEDIDDAVKAARAAYEGAWGKLTAAERGDAGAQCALAEVLYHVTRDPSAAVRWYERAAAGGNAEAAGALAQLAQLNKSRM